jgi:hypothetical protein
MLRKKNTFTTNHGISCVHVLGPPQIQLIKRFASRKKPRASSKQLKRGTEAHELS